MPRVEDQAEERGYRFQEVVRIGRGYQAKLVGTGWETCADVATNADA